jgi:hypothetical protein
VGRNNPVNSLALASIRSKGVETPMIFLDLPLLALAKARGNTKIEPYGILSFFICFKDFPAVFLVGEAHFLKYSSPSYENICN